MLKKKKGNVMVQFICIFLIYFLFIACMFAFTVFKINTESEIISDSIISSNLATYKHIDMKKLGADPTLSTIVIEDPYAAYETFKRHLKYNLSLDGNFNPLNSISFIKSKVSITSFIIYNLEGNDVTIYELNPSTQTFNSRIVIDGKNTVETSKGTLVEASTVHSEIGFNKEVIFGKTATVTKAEDTDITKN